MSTHAEQIRHQLLVLVRRRSCRVLGWPRDWRPAQVLDPESGEPFTPEGAWDFIVTLLEGGVEIEEKKLDDGKTAYVILTPVACRTLYVKLQLGSGRVIGRSFHYSKYQETEDENEPAT